MKPSRLSLVVLFFVISSAMHTLASSLVQMQLQNVTTVVVTATIDHDSGIDEEELIRKSEEILIKSGLQERSGPRVLNLVTYQEKVTDCSLVAVYVSVRFEDDVVLRRDPKIDLGSFPTITWQKEYLRVVPEKEARETAERIILDCVQLFADQVYFATKVAKEKKSER